MSNPGFSSGRGRNSVGPDKVDMSLDDIIRLNKKEQQTRRQSTGNLKGQFPKGRGVATRNGGPIQRGGGVTRGAKAARFGVRGRKIPPPAGRRRGQGVITGLAARRTASLQKGISPFNRPPVNQKSRPFVQRNNTQYRRLEGQMRPHRPTDMQRGPNTAARRPFQLKRRPLPPVQQAQRDARQATFLSRRGLKVHTQVQKPVQPIVSGRNRQWRTSTNSSGILTVSIDNPTARTQPEPPSAWSLHPPAPSIPPPKMEVVEEKKPPKGVPLEFDINSVGKPQTKMTLNERFRILKDQRFATTATASKGSRFVTVA
ncbi:UAP56-interacting factor-like isoform X1 [Osmerus eperlanus]|uniref:UAP56-interacting factor-like isoform X1 n=1 Tax=Osmerus eperlanus TaxID=29151 RepID=UPI002E0D6B0A